jgi:Protein of unknown function (DUF3618)
MSQAGAAGGQPARSSANGAANGTAPLPSDPAALERLIGERRDRLAATVDELVHRAAPREIARRGQQDAVARLRVATYTPDGRLRVERVAAVAVAVTSLVVLAAWRRRRR